MKWAFLALLNLSATQVWAQKLAPEYDYNGIGRPVWIRVSGGSGSKSLLLIDPVTKKTIASSPVGNGRQDLSNLFPQLWKNKVAHVLYVQLAKGENEIGSPLVLQPMVSAKISRLKPDGKTIEFVDDEDQVYSGVRTWVDRDIELKTNMGDMRFHMRPDCAPNTVWDVTHFVSGGLYRNVIWHRVVASSHGFPFVIQGGDPAGTGSGGPGYAYALEDSSLPHDFGVISIARSTDPNTNGCQIFVCLSREGTSRLDHKYASFGQCIKGSDVIRKIAAVPVGKEDRPLNPPVIFDATLVESAPYPVTR